MHVDAYIPFLLSPVDRFQLVQLVPVRVALNPEPSSDGLERSSWFMPDSSVTVIWRSTVALEDETSTDETDWVKLLKTGGLVSSTELVTVTSISIEAEVDAVLATSVTL